MRTIVKGKNIELPDRVRTYAERKLRRLERLLDDRTDAIVELSNEQHKSAADAHIAEVTLIVNGQTLRSHAVGPTYQAAIDAVIDRAERQAVDHKERPRDRARSTEGAQRREGAAEAQTAEEGPRVVRVKRFAIEPMFEEDAISQMEELGHAFFLFVNAENERLNLLYRRRDGNYGIIEPIVGGEYTPGRGQDRTAGRRG
ncbi:MAG TPA: ribosome-associated translation inhibitor RaiA [Candidatus Binatia bacterium]|nr:ribosome-associated translation inhibitor RaiA [Candidatus Binatia bacterium]